MGKKTLPILKSNCRSIGNRSRKHQLNHLISDTNASIEQINQIDQTKSKDNKNEICSICLNQIKVRILRFYFLFSIN